MNKKRNLLFGLILSLALSILCIPADLGIAQAAAQKVTISEKKVTITEGKKKTLTVKTTPKSLADKVKWSTSDKKVAKVSKKGVVTAVKSGKATITAKVTSGKKTLSAKCAVTVKAKKAAALKPGVTVKKDAASPTGYTATFVYENANAKEVELAGTFAFYKEGEQVGVLPAKYYTPFEWKPGMFRASSTDLAASFKMSKKEGTNYWTIDVPLPSGHYLYNYKVDGSNLTDPANGPMKSTAESGSTAKLSTVDVPYASVQGASIDFSFMMPQKNTASGQIVFKDYTDVDGNKAPLAIYLPSGYDANRTRGYKVLYLSHGGGGNETEWFSSGSTHHVFDNLIAKGAVEPTIVVTMSNGVYKHPQTNWDFAKIHDNMMKCVIPFMEETYNIGKTPSDRAFAGLSMGGMTTTYMYAKEAANFGYFGIFSGSTLTGFTDDVNVESLKLPKVMLGAGYYDMALMPGTGAANSTTGDLCVKLDQLGIKDNAERPQTLYKYYNVKGGHDWTTWPQLVKIFAERYLWK